MGQIRLYYHANYPLRDHFHFHYHLILLDILLMIRLHLLGEKLRYNLILTILCGLLYARVMFFLAGILILD